MALLTDEHLAWIGRSDPPVTVEVHRRDIRKYATATEQVQQKYLAGDEAPPMFIFNLFTEVPTMDRFRVDGLATTATGGPRLPLHRVMAGGTSIRIERPIVPGDVLTGTRSITDLYEKQGSTGPLIFTVRALSIVDADGKPVMTETQTGIAR